VEFRKGDIAVCENFKYGGTSAVDDARHDPPSGTGSKITSLSGTTKNKY
jgi:hypothetical protein